MMNPAEPLFCFVLQFAAYRFNLGSKKEKDYDKENQGKLPRCHEDLLSLVIGWPL